jgi:hypothetical protein
MVETGQKPEKEDTILKRQFSHLHFINDVLHRQVTNNDKVQQQIVLDVVPILTSGALWFGGVFLRIHLPQWEIHSVTSLDIPGHRYAQAIPTRNQTARTTAEFLFNKHIVHYGIPERLHSDQGANFESKVIEELCRIWEIHSSTSLDIPGQ